VIVIISFSPWWVVIVFFFIASNNINTYVIAFIIALLHEAGHMLAAKILGYNTQGIRIEPFGVCLKLEGEQINCLHEVIICAFGPIVNIILIILGTIFVYIGVKVPEVFFVSNFYMLFINLLPILPLDGGRILKSVLCAEIGDLLSKKIVKGISVICVAIMLVCGVVFFVRSEFNISLFVAALFLLDNITLQENKACNLASLLLTDVCVAPVRVFCVNENILVKEALKKLPFDNINIVCVLNSNGEIIKIVTNKYILNLISQGCSNKKISEVHMS